MAHQAAGNTDPKLSDSVGGTNNVAVAISVTVAVLVVAGLLIAVAFYFRRRQVQ